MPYRASRSLVEASSRRSHLRADSRFVNECAPKRTIHTDEHKLEIRWSKRIQARSRYGWRTLTPGQYSRISSSHLGAGLTLRTRGQPYPHLRNKMLTFVSMFSNDVGLSTYEMDVRKDDRLKNVLSLGILKNTSSRHGSPRS